MGDRTKITWATASWNPVSGCTPISPGCEHCYARGMAMRLQAMGQEKYKDGFKVTMQPGNLHQPGKWKKPRTIFVCSMGDLFHTLVPDDYIRLVFLEMIAHDRHTFLVLTKWPRRMKEFLAGGEAWKVIYKEKHNLIEHIWLGVTAENQVRFNDRVSILIQTLAAHRWVNIGPMLEPIAMEKYSTALDWVSLEGESGPRARHMEEDWARDVMQQCDVADVPFHLKQYSGLRPKKCPELDGHTYTAMPPFQEM